MITQPTVLILGAGASMPYKFPSGRGLLDLICKHLEGNRNSGFWRDLRECRIDDATIERFRDDLYLSQKQSVDAFLEHRPELMKVGKLAIARALIPFEQSHSLMAISRHPPKNAQTSPWYHYLFSHLACKPEDFRGNKLIILTYNYDRSIEEFLFRATKHSYDLADAEIKALLAPIRVIHLHGQLGVHPCYADDAGSARSYDVSLRPETLKKCATQIQILHEEITGSTAYPQALGALRQAKRVCFLGFGFDPVNVQRLCLASFNGPNVHYWGTVYGLGEGEIETVQGYFREASIDQVDLGTAARDCLDYLRSVSILS